MKLKKLIYIGVLVVSLGVQGCAEKSLGIPLPTDGFQFPTGLAVHPDGWALVLSSNIDLAYVHGALRAIDLNGLAAELAQQGSEPVDPYYRQFILSDQSIGLDNFGGTLSLSSDGRLAALTIRETDELVLVDVESEGGALSLNCWPSQRPTGVFPYCSGSRNVVGLSADDPYDVILLDGEDSGEGPDRTAYVSFLRSGEVHAIDIPGARDDVPRVLYSLETDVAGASDLAIAAGTGLVYVTSRFAETQANPVHYFDPGLGEESPVRKVNFFDEFLGSETRSVAFASDGLTAGLLVRNPDMLVFVDTSLDYSGQPTNDFLSTVALGNNPSRVRSLGDRMYVTGAKDDAVYVIDARTRRMLAIREDICRGPFEVAFWDRGDLLWGLIGCFEDSTIAVLDVDPDSPTYLDVLARVGEPREED